MKTNPLLLNFTRYILPYLRCFIILFIILKLGEAIVYLLHIQIPASVIGLFILFIGLATNIIPVSWIKLGCNFIMKYMTILFIPPSMGIMDTYVDVIHDWLPIFGGILGSTLIIFFFVAILTEKMKARG